MVFCCGRQRQPGWCRGPRRAPPPRSALTCHGTIPSGHAGQRSQPCPAAGHGLCATPQTPKIWPSGSIVASPHSSSAGCEFLCEKAVVLSGETGPVAPNGGDQMSRSCQAAQASEGTRRDTTMAPRATGPPLRRWPTWKSRPAAAAWEMPVAKSAAISRRQNLSQAVRPAIKGRGSGSGPTEAPQEQWQSFREPAAKRLTKALAAPRPQLLPRHKTRERKFGYFHLNPLRRRECEEWVSTLALCTPSLRHRRGQPGGLGDHLLKVCSTISRCSLVETRPFLYAAAGTERGDRQQRGTERNLARYVLFCREDAELFVC
nr:uncharacterized protein LOC125184388 [Anser cygnoides]